MSVPENDPFTTALRPAVTRYPRPSILVDDLGRSPARTTGRLVGAESGWVVSREPGDGVDFPPLPPVEPVAVGVSDPAMVVACVVDWLVAGEFSRVVEFTDRRWMTEHQLRSAVEQALGVQRTGFEVGMLQVPGGPVSRWVRIEPRDELVGGGWWAYADVPGSASGTRGTARVELTLWRHGQGWVVGVSAIHDPHRKPSGQATTWAGQAAVGGRAVDGPVSADPH